MIFRIVATADLSGISAWRLWLAFFAAFALSWAAGTFLIRRLFGRDARAGLVAGLAAGYGNTTLIGIPLALAAFGADGSVPMALIIAVQLPIMMTIVAALMVRAERQDGVGSGERRAGVARSIAKSLVENPIIVGMAAGVVWRLSGVPLSGLPADHRQPPRRRREHTRALRHGHEPEKIRLPRPRRPGPVADLP